MHTVLGVHDEQADVGAFHRARGAECRIELEIFFDLAALAQPGGVDEDELAALVLKWRVDGIARRPGLVVDDQPVLTEELVDQTRLADVRPADDGHVDGFAFVGFRSIRQQRHEPIEQIATALPHRCGHGERIAEAQLIERELARLVGEIVRLVHDQQQRPLRLTEKLGDLEVQRVDPRFDVDHEEQHVAVRDRLLDLRADRAVDRIGRPGDQAPGVHQPEPPAVPLSRREMPVAGHAGLRIDDRLAASDDAIEQRRFSDVGATDDGDGRDTHTPTPSATKASAKSYDSLIGIESCAASS